MEHSSLPANLPVERSFLPRNSPLLYILRWFQDQDESRNWGAVLLPLLIFPLLFALTAPSIRPTQTPSAAKPFLHSSIEAHLARANEGWGFVGRYSEVATYMRQSDPASPLLAFRGVAALDVHIAEALGPFVNVTNSLEWVGMLKAIERLPALGGAGQKAGEGEGEWESDVIYQVLNLPWPISPRDILLSRSFSFNPHMKQVTVSYRSIEDERVPEVPGVIRGHSPHTMWRFTVLEGEDEAAESSHSTAHSSNSKTEEGRGQQMERGGRLERVGEIFQHLLRQLKLSFMNRLKAPLQRVSQILTRTRPHNRNNNQHTVRESQEKRQQRLSVCQQKDAVKSAGKGMRKKVRTLVEVESMVDSKGSIPAWFLNYMQRFWPAMTLRTFEKMALKGLIEPDPRVLCW